MIKFRLFNIVDDKFIPLFKAPLSILEKKNELGIKRNLIPEENLKKLIRLNSKTKNLFEIYVYKNNEYVPAKNYLKKSKKSSKKSVGKVKGVSSKSKKNNRKDDCLEFKNKSHKGYEKNCVYQRCKTCTGLRNGNYWDDTEYKSKDFRSLDSGPCKYNNKIVEYVDYSEQFKEMGLDNTNSLKNGFPAGSKKLKKYGLKNC